MNLAEDRTLRRRGETRASDAEVYGKYPKEKGSNEIRRTKGNRGVWLLRRLQDGKAQFIVLSLWESVEAIKEFAGPDFEQARYDSEVNKFLLSIDPSLESTKCWLVPSLLSAQ